MATDKILKAAGNGQRELVLSSDPSRAVQDLITVIEVLYAIYQEETSALLKSDVKAFMALQDRKISAARMYQSGAGQLLDRRDEIKAKADPRLQQMLFKRQEEFAVISQENMTSLERMRKSTKRLSDRIMQAARDTIRSKSHAYSARGHMAQNERRVSFSLNESA